MAKINRHYQPVKQEYVSQFMPEDLTLMQNALTQRQKGADETIDKLDVYEDELLNMKAFGDSDSAYLKKKRGELEEYVSSLSNEDMGSAKTIRDTASYIRKFKNDEGLGKVQSAYAHNAKAKEAMDKLISTGKYTEANVNDYLQSAQQYSKTGFEGDQLANNAFSPNVDVREGVKKLTASMKANGYGYDEIKGMWKIGRSGSTITGKRLMDAMNASAPGFMDTEEGKQLIRNARYKGISVTEEFENIAKSVVLEKAQGTHTSSIDAESNYWKKKEEVAANKVLNLPGSTNPLGNFADMNDLTNTIKTLEKTDPYAASALKGQKEVVRSKYMETLTPQAKKIFGATGDDILQIADPTNTAFGPGLTDKIKVLEVLARGITVRDDGDILAQPSIIPTRVTRGKGEEARTIKGDKAYAKRLYENIINQDLKVIEERFKEEYLGTNEKTSYGTLKKELDKALVEGKFVESTDFFASPSKDDVQTNNFVASSIKGAIDSKNFKFKSSSGEKTDPAYALANISPGTFHVNVGANGTTLKFITKGDKANKIPSENITITSKSLGRALTENDYLYGVLEAKYGGSPEFQMMIDNVNSQNYKALSAGSTLSQTDKMFGVNKEALYGRWNLKQSSNKGVRGISIYSIDKKTKVSNEVLDNKIMELYDAGQQDLARKLESIYDIYDINPTTGEKTVKSGAAIFTNESAAKRALEMLFTSLQD